MNLFDAVIISHSLKKNYFHSPHNVWVRLFMEQYTHYVRVALVALHTPLYDSYLCLERLSELKELRKAQNELSGMPPL